MSDVFISYASADRERAQRLAEALMRHGYSVWWDRTIPPGRMFDEVIQEAIQDAQCMVVLWSAESVRSNWVKTEAAEGVARGMLVPALLDPVLPPIEFKRIQSANLAQWQGDDAHAEFRNLLDSIARLIHEPRKTIASHERPALNLASSMTSGQARLGAFKMFALGLGFALCLFGAWWLYGKFSNPRTTDASASSPSAPAAASTTAAATDVPSDATTKPAGASASRARPNLLAAENGGELVIASSERWSNLIDGKEDTYAWTDDGFGVFGFRDGKSALIDTFTVFVPAQTGNNMKNFELLISNTAATGPYESIGHFETQNMRMMQKPYQEFHFTPIKAKYLKLQSLRSHDGTSTCFVYEIQLFGTLQ